MRLLALAVVLASAGRAEDGCHAGKVNQPLYWEVDLAGITSKVETADAVFCVKPGPGGAIAGVSYKDAERDWLWIPAERFAAEGMRLSKDHLELDHSRVGAMALDVARALAGRSGRNGVERLPYAAKDPGFDALALVHDVARGLQGSQCFRSSAREICSVRRGGEVVGFSYRKSGAPAFDWVSREELGRGHWVPRDASLYHLVHRRALEFLFLDRFDDAGGVLEAMIEHRRVRRAAESDAVVAGAATLAGALVAP